jgi:murein DD-endopeptidase MepM/ murein hydrolase activator NlpD
MKKLFYFSKTSLQYVEIKNFKSKLTYFFSFLVFLFIAFGLGGYLLFSSIFNPGIIFKKGDSENTIISEKMDVIVNDYLKINKELDSLVKVNNDLRVVANLPPISDEEKNVGVGGGYFDNNIDFSKDLNFRLKTALTYIEEITRKVEFEKSKYVEISNKMIENKLLFESIPAIKPCEGTLSEHGFGMRIHPVLNILRMHEGIDIITEIGSAVYSSGKGTVDFIGIKGGYGLCVEINHGFGYTTLYGHLSSTSVQLGQKVLRGTVIARTGNSGLSSGPHLHYEVTHNGVKLDPVGFFFDDLNIFALNHKN